MASEHDLLSIVGGIYSAASDPARWPAVLDSLVKLVPAQAAALEMHNFKTAGSRVAFSVNWKSTSQEYEKYYASKNILLLRGAHLMNEGAIHGNEAVCSDTEFHRSEYYNDLLQPNDIGYVLGSTILRRASIAAVLMLGRPRRNEPFGTAEKQTVGLLMPHLQSALQLHERLIHLEFQRRDLGNALDVLPVGVVLVDGRGKILLLNRSAQRILQASDGLSAGLEGLCVHNREQANALRGLIAGATAVTKTIASHPGGVLSVRRPSLRRDYALLVCPMPAMEAEPILSERAAAAIFITDPEAQCEAPPQLFMRLFGLTAAEARLSILLMEGKTLAEAAETLGITRNTAQSQLKAVFGKTGARRQSELLKLLLSGPAQLRVRAA